jgi:integration host factor subunit beta
LPSFELILKAIGESLEKGERMEVRGFGSLSTRIRKPIRGRNPQSGEAIELSERKVPYFRASQELNQKLN